jgi:O-antigen/teichoic acid export membrane protein
VRDGLLVLGAQGTGALIALLADRWLFQTLPKAEQGALSGGLALSGTLLLASDLGLALTTIRVGARLNAEGDTAGMAALFRRTLRARILLGVLFSTIPLLCGGFVARTLHLETGGWLIGAAAASVLGNAVVWWALDVSQARRRFGTYAVQQISSAAFRAGAIAAGLLLFKGAFGLPVSELMLWLIAAAAALCGIVCVLPALSALRGPLELEPVRDQRLFAFGAYACVISILSALNANVDIQMVQALLPLESTADFACARRLALALNLLATATVTVLLPRAAALTTAESCRAYLRKALSAGVLLALGFGGGLALTAGPFIVLFGGERYLSSIPILRLLCVAQGVGIVLTPLSLVLYPLHRERAVIAFNAAQLALQIVLALWLIPTFGLPGAAWSAILARCGAGVVLAWALWVVLAPGRNDDNGIKTCANDPA